MSRCRGWAVVKVLVVDRPATTFAAGSAGASDPANAVGPPYARRVKAERVVPRRLATRSTFLTSASSKVICTVRMPVRL
jgi:hypothetical protein